MNKNILLSIVIPTKNREEYAYSVVKQILSISSNNFQLVIQDNSDTDLLKTKLNDFENDIRLEYSYERKLLSFVDNFSLGIDKCIGEYVIIIGDDDGVNPDILMITEWAKNNNIDAIIPSLSLVYFWPKSGVRFASIDGTLKINDFTSNMKSANAKKELRRFLENGCHNYLEYGLGKAYHGIVKKSVLETIKNKTGKYVGGLTPDIYLSVAISLIAEKIKIIDYPFTISGICGKSGSSDSSTGKHTGELDEAPHLKGHTNYSWSKSIPPFYSVETIWADSVLAAINDLGETLFLEYFNKDVITVRCLKKYPRFKNLIIEHFQKTSLTKNKKILNYLLFKARIIVFIYNLHRLKSRIYKKITRKHHVYNNVSNIQEAAILSLEYIRNNKNKLTRTINE